MTLYTWLSMHKKVYIPVFFGVFTTILLFGALISSIATHPEASPCIFDSSDKCVYGFSEHILDWQSTFFVSNKDSMQYLWFAVGLALVYSITIPAARIDVFKIFIENLFRSYRQRCRTYISSLFTYLCRLLQRGILHPKLF